MNDTNSELKFQKSQSDESSASSSDSENDEVTSRTSDWIVESESPSSHPVQLQCEINGSAAPNSKTYFGDVNIESSSKVHLGNNIIYNGSVVINQIINSNSVSARENNLEVKNSGDAYSTKSHKLLCFRKELARRKKCVAAIFTLIMILLGTALVILQNYHTEDEQNFTTAEVSTTTMSTTTIKTTTTYEEIQIDLISRKDWNASAPKRPLKKLAVFPAPYIIISHADSEICWVKLACLEIVQERQFFAQKYNDKDDIIYNFLVGGDGNVYEGRGWNFAGQHTENYDGRSFGIVFIGNFDYAMPKQRQIEAAEKLLRFAVQEHKVSSDYKLLGERQVVNGTSSPGRLLYEYIVNHWDHWTEDP